MPKIAFSDATVRALSAPPSGQVDYWDAKFPSFGCRVSQGGSKTFVVKLYNSRRTIGRYPTISLADAREQARHILAEKTLGKVRPQSITFTHARSLFIADKERAKKQSTAAEYKRLLNRLNFSGQLAELSHSEMSRLLARFKSPSEHAHLVVAAKCFFNWCIKRRYITDNPLTGISRSKSPTRARVLSDAELRAIWDATEEPSNFNAIVRLLILTGQRRGEIAAMHATYCDTENNLVCLPPSLTKNGREHRFPIGALSQELFASRLQMSRGYLLPARGKDAPYNGWSKSKRQLDQRIVDLGRRMATNWTLHDLRRTFATRLAEMGVAPHIIERLLNHVSGQISGISAVYNRAQYLPEMRAAVDLWDARIRALCGIADRRKAA